MSNSNKKQKVLVLLLGLVLGMMMPKIAHAQLGGGMLGHGRDAKQQNHGGLFRGGNHGGYNLNNQQFGEENGGYNLYNQTFGQDAPLGSGLLILTAAGAGYALRKRKNNKKRKS